MGYLANVVYFGGTHGAYLRYFLDRFSKKTPPITQSPFLPNGTSHSLDVTYSGAFNRYTLEDPDGKPYNNYEFKNEDPHIFINFTADCVYNHLRLYLKRPSDHELTSHQVQEMDRYILCSDDFARMYSEKIRDIYNVDLSKTNSLLRSIARDFFKIMIIDRNNHQMVVESKNITGKIRDIDHVIDLKNFYDTDNFIIEMQELNNKMNLDLEIEQSAYDLHNEFISKMYTSRTYNRARQIVDAVKDGKFDTISGLDVVEEAYINATLEESFDFVIMPFVENFFQDTHEVLRYIENFPNHYKAMNPNLPNFNGKPNPFHLWKSRK